MSRVALGIRLAWSDLRRRTVETMLLFVALAVAATTLTIGLVLHGQTAAPYALTRARTAGPDVVATLFPAPHQTVTTADRLRLAAVAADPQVRTSSRVFPTTWAAIDAHGTTGVAEVQGRDRTASAVDRPALMQGRWFGDDGVVVERAFADALGLSVGDVVNLAGHHEEVVGVAVSAALPPYPQLCTVGCILDRPDWSSAQPGLVWMPRQRVVRLASAREPLVWMQYLRLRDPQTASAFAEGQGASGPPAGQPELTPWQDVAHREAEQLANERTAIIFGSTLLVILALATLVVLVGGRMSDEIQRVGMLKVAGATPGFVTALVLATYLLVGLGASAAGLLAGRLLTPALVGLSAGLLGHTGTTPVTITDVIAVFATILAVVVGAVVGPAWRAARMSTVRALGGQSRTPRRHALLLPLSARLPTPALLGMRLAVRRPRRSALTILSVAVAICGATVVLFAQSSLHAERGNAGGPTDPQVAQLQTVTTALTVLLAVMAAVNLVFITRLNAVDARRNLAVARVLGASPTETAAGIGIAQILPTLVGLTLGGVTGAMIFHTLSSSDPTRPPIIQLVELAAVTITATVAMTALPARIEARRPIAATLREA